MKSRLAALLAVLCLAALGLWLFWLRPAPPSSTGSNKEEGSFDSGRAIAAAPVLNALLTTPLPERRGTLSIRGRVTNASAPVPGAAVTATSGAGEDVLSAMTCACDNSCGQKLLSCACAESGRQLLELVVERRGEAPPVARTTSAADGSFVLDGLDKGAFAIWAEKEGAGIGLSEKVESGSSGVEIRISNGIYIEGDARGDDTKPIAGAVVTAIYAEHSRFFDALTNAEGKFRIGPVPVGRFTVVGVRQPLLPDRAQVAPDSASGTHLVLSAPRLLAGKVLRDGRAAEGAQIELTGNHRVRKTAAGTEGSFSFSDLRSGSYSLRAVQGTVAAVQQVVVRTGEDQLDLVLSLGAAAELSGFVRDRSRSPITGARIRLWKSSNSGATQAVTSADGSFHAPPLDPGLYSIAVSAAGYRASDSIQRTIVPGAPSTLEIVLDPAASCTGSVSSPDGRGLEGAVVTVTAPDEANGRSSTGRYSRATSRTTTKPDGAFAADGLAPGSYRLRIEHPLYQPSEELISVPRDGLRFVLKEGSELNGTVIEEGGGSVMGATVALERADKGPEIIKSSFSDAEGKFTLRGLPKGAFTLRASLEVEDGEDRTASLAVDTGSGQPVVLRFPKGLSISGAVVDANGATIAGATVAARTDSKESRSRRHDRSRAVAISTDAGTFRIEHLKEGNYSISAMKDGFQPSDIDRAVTAGDQTVRLTLLRAPHIKGRVLKPDGSPVQSFEVDGRAVSDSGGKFDIPVPDAEALQYEASQSKPLVVHVHAAGFSTARRELSSQLTQDFDLGDIPLSAARTVAGKVVDEATGAALAGVAIAVSPPDDNGATWWRGAEPSAFSDGEGKFKFAADADIVLRARRDGYAPWSSSGSVPDQLTIALKAGSRIAGSVHSKSGEPLKDLAVWALMPGERSSPGQATTGADGAFEISGLAPGTYQVHVVSKRPFTAMTATVPETGLARADFVERSGGASMVLSFEGENEPSWHVLVPGEVAPPVALKELASLFRIAPSNEDSASPRYDSLSLGRYTLFVFETDDSGMRFDRRIIDLRSEGEQRISMQLPSMLPFSLKNE
jgi:protocatechuate 3,4-dioxygenase beta subunit